MVDISGMFHLQSWKTLLLYVESHLYDYDALLCIASANWVL